MCSTYIEGKSVIDERFIRALNTEIYIFFFNWDSLHARLNSYFKTWSYKKKKHKEIKAYRKSL